MQFIDLIIIFLLLLGFLWGFFKGFFYMIFSFLGIATGTILGLRLPLLIFDILKMKPILLYQILSFIIIFIICYFLISSIGSQISDTLENLDLGWIDSLLGGFLGIIQITLITGLLIILLDNFKLLKIFPDIEKSILPFFIKNITENLLYFITKIKK